MGKKRAEGERRPRQKAEKPKRKKAEKPKRGRGSSRGDTERARERAAGFVPSPNFGFIAGDPLKAKIVAIALQRPYSPSEFSKDEEIGLGAAAYVFRTLKKKSIIELVKEEKVRGAVKHMYRANEAAFVSDADWGELSEVLRPLFTGTILEDFSRRVRQAIETGHLFERHDFTLYWAPQDLDEIAYMEQVEIAAWCIEESKRLVCDTVERRANGESPEGGSFPVTFAIAAFLSPTHSEYEAYTKKTGEAEKSEGVKGKSKAKAKRSKASGGGAKRKASKSRRKVKKGKGKKG